MTKTIITRFCLLLCAIILHTNVFAQQYSYVYIQGDKTLPFYVKLGDEMLPRYGKNYCILPMLEAGEITIEILFQQNKYPAEHFTIKVPENSSRSFLLTKKDAAYSLYDLQQGFYLRDGNIANDDHLPAITQKIFWQPDSTLVLVTPIPSKKPLQEQNPPAEVKKKKEPLLKKEKKQAPAQGNTPEFIDNIELVNKHQKETAENKPQQEEKLSNPPATTITNIAPASVPNSDCPEPISSDEMEKIYKKAMAEESEESRLGYLLQQGEYCFSTAQLSLLAKSLDSDTARYSLLKKLYARTTDQANFPDLENLFVSEDWKNYFKQLIQK